LDLQTRSETLAKRENDEAQGWETLPLHDQEQEERLNASALNETQWFVRPLTAFQGLSCHNSIYAILFDTLLPHVYDSDALELI